MVETKWIIVLNFVLFGILLLALLYTIFSITLEAGLPSVWNEFRSFDSDESAHVGDIQRNVPIVTQEPNEEAEFIDGHLEYKFRLYAQYAAISSYCTTYPEPSACLKDWDKCVDNLQRDQPVLAPAMTFGTNILYNFSTYAHSWTGGEGYIALEREKSGNSHKLVIAFGGSTVTLDWFNDFRAWSTKYIPLNSTVVKPIDFENLRVHAGLFDIYNTLRPHVTAALNAALSKYEVSEITLTGHSLGGSLASLLTLDVRYCQWIRAQGGLCAINNGQLETIPLRLYTFGQPRFGNGELMQFFSEIMNPLNAMPQGIYFRIVNEHDVVSVLPPEFIGYKSYPGVFYSVSPDSSFLKCASKDMKYCRFRGFTRFGHVSYIWNFDDVKEKCKLMPS